MKQGLLTTHCYVRAQSRSINKQGTHRVACLAFAPTDDPTTVRVAWSVCNHNDNFDSTIAKTKAISRLNSDRNSVVLKRNVNDIVINSGIIPALHKFRSPTEYFTIDSFVAGALSDLAEITK